MAKATTAPYMCSATNLALVFIKKYVENDGFNKMIQAYDKKDYKALFETAHNVKGMTANLGLKSLSNISSSICESVRKGEPDMDLEPLIENAKKIQTDIIKNVALLDE